MHEVKLAATNVANNQPRILNEQLVSLCTNLWYFFLVNDD